jgi:DNA-binding transcriptional LysR family regulator
MPHLVAFLEAFSDITVEMHCDNALVDLVGGSFDAGIRLGENLAQDMVAVPFGGRQRIATVAAPRYLAGRSLPRKPEDLSAHQCINVRLAGGIYRWCGASGFFGHRFGVKRVFQTGVVDVE